MPSHGAVGFVAEGSYRRLDVSSGPAAQVEATEWSLPTAYLADNFTVSSSGTPRMFSWIRAQHFLYGATENICYEWFLIRTNSDIGSTPDMNNDKLAERLHGEGRILKRGMVWQSAATIGGVVKQKIELYNVKLGVDEYLQIVIRPMIGTSLGLIFKAVVEWREVGV